ncbi:MAG: hypothetical protein ACRD2W_12130 [Acidimicrobiales bacterium]
MFDVDQFVADLRAARAEDDHRLAIKEVVERAVHNPVQVADALPATRAEIVPIHTSPDLSVMKVVWAPGMSFRPHNHLMWAVIGLYGGQEDNTFYRRPAPGQPAIVPSGGRELRVTDVALLGDDTIHAVTNPCAVFTGAIHVYGGDLTRRPGRSEWDEATMEEVCYDFERTRKHFEDANAVLPEA